MSEDTKKELQKVEIAQEKLSTMEKNVKAKADEVDAKIKELDDRESGFEEKFGAREAAVSEKEAALLKKLNIVDAGEVFTVMVKTVNDLYNAYYSVKGTDEGLLEALQSILSARQSVTK